SLFLWSFALFVQRADLRDLHSFPTRRSSDLAEGGAGLVEELVLETRHHVRDRLEFGRVEVGPRGAEGLELAPADRVGVVAELAEDRKSTRLNSSHVAISYAVFCLKKKKKKKR